MPLLLCALLALLVSGSALAIEVLAAEVPPYAIKSQQGAPTGMAVEVLEEAARRLGEPLHIEVLPFARALSQARHRKDVLLLPPPGARSAPRTFSGLCPCSRSRSCWSPTAVTTRPRSPWPRPAAAGTR
nr:hypothetical protein [Aeromonas schubertii]